MLMVRDQLRQLRVILSELLNWFLEYCWFSHDVTTIQTTKLLILLIFYFHDVQEQLKANFHAQFCSEWVLR